MDRDLKIFESQPRDQLPGRSISRFEVLPRDVGVRGILKASPLRIRWARFVGVAASLLDQRFPSVTVYVVC